MGNRYSDGFVEENQHRIDRVIIDIFKHPESSIEFQEKKLHIRQWLGCFKKDPPKHCPLALKILESIDYYSSDDIRKMIKEASDMLKKEFSSEFSNITFAAIGNTSGTSGSQFLYSLKHDLRLSDKHFPKDFKTIDPNTTSTIVFIDDMIGSGMQVEKFYKNELENKFPNVIIYYFALIGYKNGIDHIRQNTKFNKVFAIQSIDANQKAFDGPLKFPDQAERDEIRKMAESYGQELYRHGALGWDNSQALIVFPYNTPNNTLPIIWAGTESESETFVSWHPVCPRKKIIWKDLKEKTEANTDSQSNRHADSKNAHWVKYKYLLTKQTQESMFSETFSLSQIYIPLCAYYKVGEGKEEKKYVIDLNDAMCKWLDQNDNTDTVRIISGSPGSGKSSFAKMFAAEIANKHKVLFFQLHQLGVGNDIEKSIAKFLENNHFFAKTPIGNDSPLLIIFDGLDELTQQGNAGMEAARNFVDNIRTQLLNNYNAQKLQHRIILTGRELPVQEIESKFEKKQIFHVLPYYLKPITYEEIMDYEKYIGETYLLNNDKRDSWWKKYGELTGKEYEKLPDTLSSDTLIEITAQPLLNYLLAINYDVAQENTSWGDINRNKLYDILFDNVYKRVWETDGQCVAEKLKKDEFQSVLEEIAVSAWQRGESRTTTLNAIMERCKKNELDKYLISFQENAKESILNLLVAFYFRQFGLDGIDKTFEFTHKSFSEFLIAKKMVRQIRTMAVKLKQQKIKHDGWTEETALINWIDLCGRMPLNSDIHDFLCDEMQRYEQAEVKEWQDTLCKLISYMLKFGMPFEKISFRPKFIEETEMSRNAEESLLATLSSCSRFSNKISKIKWEDAKSAGKWLSKLYGQSDSESLIFTFSCLNNLDLSKMILCFKDLCNANLQKSNLQEASLTRAYLERADLRDADLRKINLRETNLTGALLSNVDFRGADLAGANLQGTDLNNANLTKVDLTGTDLRGSEMKGTNLTEANLSGTDLSEVTLDDAILNGADLTKADLSKADFRKTNLFCAKLEGATLQKSDLSEADLQKALTSGAILV
ncbi:MAG: pentapeptide repeat-containing protein [Treponema sp.]|nr:pentapeptide repeat-containing protein [Treponema sp.]